MKIRYKSRAEIELMRETNLVVSEIFYHPEGTGDHEFIELTNISSRAIDLTEVSFDGGIAFTFPAGSTVQAGGRVLVTSSEGELLAFDALTGGQSSVVEISGLKGLGPVVANGTVYVLTEDADLVALR